MERQSKGKIGTIISILICVILVPLVIINSVLIVKSYTDSENIPSAFGISPLVVLSGSMSPTFETNAIIFIKDTDVDTLEVGDVICFLRDGVAITHRIYEITETDGVVKYITKGDANNVIDALSVSQDQIQGVYISHIPALGGVAMFMQTTTGVIVCVVIPICVYLLFDIIKRKKDSKEDKDKTAELQEELARLRGQLGQSEEDGE